jgi:5-methyltetrahydrofolate--homocysteine methyltransferase
MPGMQRVGVDFRDGALFLPEVLLAAETMHAVMRVLEPLLAGQGAARVGVALLGTVKGDIHDIGKNLVSIFWRGGGLDVIDLGVNVKAETFVAAVERHRPDILGLSALLTTTAPYMRVVIETLEQRGLRDGLIVLVGGAAVTPALAAEIRADGCARDASAAVELAQALLAGRRGAR